MIGENINQEGQYYKKCYKSIYRWFIKHPKGYSLFQWLYRFLPVTAVLMYCMLVLMMILSLSVAGTIKVTLVPFLTFVGVTILRKKINAPRPYAKYHTIPIVKKDKDGESMPSRHTVSFTIIAMAWLYQDTVIGVGMLILAFMMGIIRVLAGVHFIKDVMAGYLIGILVGLLGFFLI